jgi:hypothetical protein
MDVGDTKARPRTTWFDKIVTSSQSEPMPMDFTPAQRSNVEKPLAGLEAGDATSYFWYAARFTRHKSQQGLPVVASEVLRAGVFACSVRGRKSLCRQ